MPDRAATDNSTASDVVEVRNPAGAGAFLIVCEHASNFIPDSFAGLGLDDAALESHIGWDPGAMAVAETMSSLLDAPLALVVCVDFTDAALIPRLTAALAPGGVFAYVARPNALCSYGPEPGQAAAWFAELETLVHRESKERVELLGRRR